MIQRPQPTTPQLGQESVWAYPRPPRLEPTNKRIRIRFHGRDLVDSSRTMRVLETSHPPVYDIPPDDIDQSMLRPGRGQSFCEWKGQAKYVTVTVNGVSAENVVWITSDVVGPFKGEPGSMGW